MAEEYCPKCFSEIGEWTNDPILTPLGLSGEDYIGFTFPISTHITELQGYYQDLEESVLPSSSLTNFLEVSGQLARHVHIEQLRLSIEKILEGLDLTLSDYFKYDKYGNETGLAQSEWTDINRVSEGALPAGHEFGDYIPSTNVPLIPQPINIRAIHIEELRIGLELIIKWVEDWLVQADNSLFTSDYSQPYPPPIIEHPAPWGDPFTKSGTTKGVAIMRTGDRARWSSQTSPQPFVTPEGAFNGSHSITISGDKVNFAANGYKFVPQDDIPPYQSGSQQSMTFYESSEGTTVYLSPDGEEGTLHDKDPVIDVRSGSEWNNVLVKVFQDFQASFESDAIPPTEWWQHFSRAETSGSWTLNLVFDYLKWGWLPRQFRVSTSVIVNGTNPTIYHSEGSINVGYKEYNCLADVQAYELSRGTEVSYSPYLRLAGIYIYTNMSANVGYISGSPTTDMYSRVDGTYELDKIEIDISPYEEEE